MDLILIYIGLSQSLFGIVLILTKKPLKIAHVILCVLILAFAFKFALDILHIYRLLPANRWFVSLSLTMLFAPLFYLYSKYITNDYGRFNKMDYLHALPSVLLILTFLILKGLTINQSQTIENILVKYLWVRNVYGFLFQMLLLCYVVLSLRIVLRFKKQSVHYYSYNSNKISLDWLVAMILSFFVFVVVIIIVSMLYEKGKIGHNVYLFRHISELIFVYILSMWGFNQKQLNSLINSDAVVVNLDLNETSRGKYQKSGLKKEDAKKYIDTLQKYMVETAVWKDPELSISKLATHTAISKHQLSEVLNEYLGKSFYVFINEYRVEYAKELLIKKDSRNWSIVAIAYECGFNSKTAFNIFFKKHTQLTPSEFRKIKEAEK